MPASVAPAPRTTAALPHDLERAIPTTRARIARRILPGAALLGILADVLLRNEPWGIGLLVWMTLFAAVAITLARQCDRTLTLEGRIWLAVAVMAASGLSWRDAEMLQVLNVFGMLTALVLLAMTFNAAPVSSITVARIRDLLRAAFGTGFDVATGTIPLLLRDTELHTLRGSSHAGNAQRVGKAMALTLPVLLLFTVLLTQADPLFGSVVRLPDFDVETLVSHVVIAGFFAWITAGWFRRALVSRPAGNDVTATPFPIALGTLDVSFVLGGLIVLFAAFVVVQLGWLFGGEALVLRTTGLGYAEYARRGFFELTGVAVLLLPTLLVANALIPADDARAHRVYRRLALVLVALLGAIMLSAGARMQLYIRYYGISTDRLYATAFMIWLAFVFGCFVATVLRSRPRLFATGLVVSGFVLLFTLNVINPDALVARANLTRSSAPASGAAGTDLKYVAALGGDAAPIVAAALTSAQEAALTARADERCAAATTLLDKWTGERGARITEHWTSWNMARSRAVKAVREREAELRGLSCPVGEG